MIKLKKLDARGHDIDADLDDLRAKLSVRGDIVSEAGRRRTVEVFGEPLSPQQVVERICSEVQAGGLAAVSHYSEKLDGAPLDERSIRVSEQELASAHAAAGQEFLAAVRQIRESIRVFQEAILHQDVEVRPRPGVVLRQRYLPLARVGLCIPGGAAAYPSTVLMTAVPAQAAGVPEIAVVAPPTENGAHNRDVLAVCQELGIREVYRVGGAQGVAALAYGIAGLPKVDKIAGPGNQFVALAKRQVYGEVDIDSIAGPSEVVVLADDSAPAAFAAADILAQAEHSPGAAVLVTWSERLFAEVPAELSRQLGLLRRSELTAESLAEFGLLILVENAAAACKIAEKLAPEHLHISAEGAERLMEKIPSAGATFLGPFTPVALGDYAAGPSHVLPTGGTARWAGGLSSNTFLRGSSVISYTREALAAEAAAVAALAEREGLTGHKASVEIRLA